MRASRTLGAARGRRVVVTQVVNVPERMAPAQPDPKLAPPWSARKDQVNGRDRVSGTHKRAGVSTQEDAPGPIMARWRRDAVSAQDLADGGGGHPVPEPTQLALDPNHAPPGVLPGQAHDQRDELVRHRRTARRPGLAPLGRYQSPVPAQQRARSHNPPGPQPLGHDPRQRGENGPISPGHPRSGVRPAQHGHFVPQREYLHILSRRGPGQQRQPGQRGHQ